MTKFSFCFFYGYAFLKNIVFKIKNILISQKEYILKFSKSFDYENRNIDKFLRIYVKK